MIPSEKHQDAVAATPMYCPTRSTVHDQFEKNLTALRSALASFSTRSTSPYVREAPGGSLADAGVRLAAPAPLREAPGRCHGNPEVLLGPINRAISPEAPGGPPVGAGALLGAISRLRSPGKYTAAVRRTSVCDSLRVLCPEKHVDAVAATLVCGSA
jgi:hypothetical protein